MDFGRGDCGGRRDFPSHWDFNYSDDELRAKNDELVFVPLPIAVTTFTIYYLHIALTVLLFFGVHTTTVKLIYVFRGQRFSASVMHYEN